MGSNKRGFQRRSVNRVPSQPGIRGSSLICFIMELWIMEFASMWSRPTFVLKIFFGTLPFLPTINEEICVYDAIGMLKRIPKLQRQYTPRSLTDNVQDNLLHFQKCSLYDKEIDGHHFQQSLAYAYLRTYTLLQTPL